MARGCVGDLVLGQGEGQQGQAFGQRRPQKNKRYRIMCKLRLIPAIRWQKQLHWQTVLQEMRHLAFLAISETRLQKQSVSSGRCHTLTLRHRAGL